MISVTRAEKSEQKNSIDTLKSCFFLQLNSVALAFRKGNLIIKFRTHIFWTKFPQRIGPCLGIQRGSILRFIDRIGSVTVICNASRKSNRTSSAWTPGLYRNHPPRQEVFPDLHILL